MTQSAPFDFVFDYLPAGIIIKKMFGMHYVYLAKRIMLILRKRDNEPELNGIWVATDKKHHKDLKKSIPELGAFFIDGDERHGNWLLISPDAEDFEGAAIKICELISHGDPRIGRLTEKGPV
ncbi:MAG TPA: hypothetical protein VK668_03570 [Mucilaginibacter sp.]|nr:hypothetical protein [Mucilaginibacter sp.]